MASRPATLILASHNRKKLLELVDLFRGTGCELRLAPDVFGVEPPEETGTTFAENAAIKAIAAARATHQWALGDDSGLLVDALGGEPGVYSSRYAGPRASDADHRAKLLQALRDVPESQRTARFECHLAVSDPAGCIRWRASGICRGRILAAERGSGGFGYDPLFLILEYHRTFAELNLSTKRVLSHRARAARNLIGRWRGLPVER